MFPQRRYRGLNPPEAASAIRDKEEEFARFIASLEQLPEGTPELWAICDYNKRLDNMILEFRAFVAGRPGQQLNATTSQDHFRPAAVQYADIISSSSNGLEIGGPSSTNRYSYGMWFFPEERETNAPAWTEICLKVGPYEAASYIFRRMAAQQALNKLIISGPSITQLKNFVLSITPPACCAVSYDTNTPFQVFNGVRARSNKSPELIKAQDGDIEFLRTAFELTQLC